MEIQRSNFTATETLKNQDGFALVLMLALMPMIMAAMIAYFLFNTTLQTWMQSSHICRTELLKTQNLVAQDLKLLLQTNDTVKVLRAEILATKAAIAAAVASYQLYLVPPLQKTLATLLHQEQAVGVLQKSLLASATQKMNLGSQTAERALKKQYQDLSPKISQFVSFKLINSYYVPNHLAVKADRPAASAAVYEPKLNFSTQQRLTVFWSTQIQILQTQWAKNWFSFKSIKTDSCSSTLEQEGENWQSVLKEDRFLLK